MKTPLALTTAGRPDGTAVVTAVGEIDLSNVDAFTAALTTALAGSRTVVVDLTAVEYLDSAGLNVLFSHAPRVEVVASALLGPVLAISGLAELTTVRGADGGPLAG
ncbi:STAS domain-containing protein [Kitasatospora sp. NPDC049258]|uniref:STAS domain-containing protein n=1 Tax=Kitasatospora sp. NPDC049258 TaxID=3155394 RepID=UPI00343D3186